VVDIKTVGVIGAGQMGSGIAHVVALGGYDVLLHDVSSERIDHGLSEIEKNMSRQVARGVIEPAAMEAAMARIRPAAELQSVGAADLAIEAATENEETKKTIFKALQPHLGANTLLASNTSSISITRLASATDRPGKFIGLHFMNPAPVMKLVEIIRGIATDADTYEQAVSFAQSLGKTTSNAEDFPAFIVNRMLMPMINEAIYTLYEGVGTVDAIDTAMRLGANHRMGPLELGDFIGLDTVLSIMNVLYEGLSDSKYRPVPAAREVRRGRLARPQVRPRLLRLPRRPAGADAVGPAPLPRAPQARREGEGREWAGAGSASGHGAAST
jgi:3-hydroxybutyryl-CoA dehydrogenase